MSNKRIIVLGLFLIMLFGGAIFITAPMSNSSIKAVVAEETVSVSFDINGGIGDFSPIEQMVGGSYIFPNTEPKKKNYRFTGWSKTLNGTPITGFDIVDKNVTTLYACWEALVFDATLFEGGYIINGFNADYADKTIIEIPANYDNGVDGFMPVYSIAHNAFLNSQGVLKLDFSKAMNLKEIGSNAFKGCDYKGEVVLSDTLVELGSYCFADCENITSVIFKEKLVTIDAFAFMNCVSLKTITFNEGLKVIGESAFFNCVSLQKLETPVSLETINKAAFEGCSKLSVVKLNELEFIEDDVFKNCNSILKVNIIGNTILSLTKASGSALSYCSAFVGNYPIVVSKNLYDSYFNNENYDYYKNRLTYDIILEFDLNEGEAKINPTDYPKLYKNYFGIMPTAEKEGYSFLGWSKTLDGDIIETSTICDVEKVYAVYQINSYTITFNSNGGSIVEVMTNQFNSVITEPAAPIKNGREFAGWYIDNEFTTKFEFTKMPAKNLILYAKWLMQAPLVEISSDKEVAIFGDEVNITITATHDLENVEFEYQWFKVVDGVDYLLENTSNKLRLFNIADSGEYYCKVIAKSGSDVGEMNSDKIVITIKRPDSAGWVLPVLIIIFGFIVLSVLLTYILGRPKRPKRKE